MLDINALVPGRSPNLRDTTQLQDFQMRQTPHDLKDWWQARTTIVRAESQIFHLEHVLQRSEGNRPRLRRAPKLAPDDKPLDIWQPFRKIHCELY